MKPSKETKAYWRAQNKRQTVWEKETPITSEDITYGTYQITQQRLQGHAAGWIDGANWVKRQMKKKGK
jgi:hypothetical protein